MACGADGRDEVEWFGTTAATPSVGAASTTVVQTGVGRRQTVAGAAAVLALLFGGWLLLGRSDPNSVPQAEATTTVPTTTVTAPADEPEAPTSSTIGADPAPAGPVLGYETGLAAISFGRRGPSVVDLDTGHRADLDLRGSPTAVVDGRLLMITRDAALTSFSLVDLDDRVELLQADANGGLQLAESLTSGTVWARRDVDDAPWRLLDVATGEVRREVDAPVVSGRLANGLWASPDLVSPRTGGVYRLGADGYERVHDGVLAGLAGEFALVQECDAELRCAWTRTRWDDWIAASEPIEANADSGALLMASGRIMVRATENGIVVVDLATGEEPLGVRDSEFFEGITADESGRFVATRFANEIRVTDLDTGAQAPLGLFGERAVLVPRESVASLFPAVS
jgi:hypothetical protein